MSRPARLTILLIALTLAFSAQSCTSSRSVISAESAPTTRSVTATPAAAPGTVCTGVTGCTIVARVDVDGDGQVDQIGVVGSKLADGGTLAVRVLTATHHLLQTTGRHVFWFGKPFFGAVPFDGHPGAEIFVGSTMGANNEQFRVITYRDGQLVTEKAPPMVWTRAGMDEATARWNIDGSYSFNIGVTRRVSSSGGVELTMSSAERNSSGSGHTGHVNVYRWQSGQWVNVSADEVHYRTDKAVSQLGGWHVTGLRHFA
jgi:hypothetical protein